MIYSAKIWEDEGENADKPYGAHDRQNHALWHTFVNGQNYDICHISDKYAQLFQAVMNTATKDMQC